MKDTTKDGAGIGVAPKAGAAKNGNGSNGYGPAIERVATSLCDPCSYEGVYHQPQHEQPMPSLAALEDIMERLKAVLFPGYFGDSEIRPETMRFHIGAHLDAISRLLCEQIKRGFCFVCPRDETHRTCEECEQRAHSMSVRFLEQLPEIRRLLATDVDAAFRGDPAAKSPGETIFCYPSIMALTHHRVAHELHKLGVSIIPRIITEMAHSRTGIDIHPGAQIGEHFFIDHGTGVVIGETCVIGNGVRLYQGVTLGAKSFPKDDTGMLVKGQPRHPVVEDDVTIYSGATILGRVTLGKGAVIGGNVWLMRSVPAGSRVMQPPGQREAYVEGLDI
ncbi:transferase hexapeptide repeat containing protein [Desulfovibrio sp. X2]|uniref:serine O-acetyltransferase n=1 Tax=Desulfovibrio sp. X2 TaxID=941449 RepID=UPI0003587706|nr:serine acetyltransferase [Desulfovibrio sp. X2]EPR37591.1 transferase hexapeptide repeat containing protein [Desulfovibrio sp. X2]